MDYIEFPGLWGLKIPISRVAFRLFGLPVYWYGIIISAGFFIAVLLAMKNSKKFGIEPDNIIDLVLFAAPAAIVGARLYYVIFNWGEFNGDILKIVNIRTGGLAIYGGLIAAVIVAMIFSRYKKINIFKLLDFSIPYFVLAQAIGRWGNFVNQEAFGANTTLPWGMTSEAIKEDLYALSQSGVTIDPYIPVHPTFLYESLWNLAVFFILIWLRKRKKFEGEVFSMYMILYGVGRFWIEGLRMDSLWFGPFRISQLLSLVFVVVFGIFFVMRRKKGTGQMAYIEDSDSENIVASEYSALLNRLSKSEDAENVEKIEMDEGNEKDDERPANAGEKGSGE